MIYIQYAHCLVKQDSTKDAHISRIYQQAIEQLEQTDDHDLKESALADIIAFYETIGDTKKKRFYENKFVKLTKERAH